MTVTLSLLSLASLLSPSSALAAIVDCTSSDGMCEVSNEIEGSVSCTCPDGTLAFGSNTGWAGLSEAELQPICEEQIAMLCGPDYPPGDGIECGHVLHGDCRIDNVPEDSIWCDCLDDTRRGHAGGAAWAGLSEDELIDQCTAEVQSLCAAAPTVFECEGPLGACALGYDPVDFATCECANGGSYSEVGGDEWAGLSRLELLMVCEELLTTGCGDAQGTDTSDGGEPGGDTTEGTTGHHGDADTGLDDSGDGPASTSGGAPGPVTTGGGSEGSATAADQDDGAGGCGCSTAPGSTLGAWALALLGLLGASRRRNHVA